MSEFLRSLIEDFIACVVFVGTCVLASLFFWIALLFIHAAIVSFINIEFGKRLDRLEQAKELKTQ